MAGPSKVQRVSLSPGYQSGEDYLEPPTCYDILKPAAGDANFGGERAMYPDATGVILRIKGGRQYLAVAVNLLARSVAIDLKKSVSFSPEVAIILLGGACATGS
jgi:hypothetical protein